MASGGPPSGMLTFLFTDIEGSTWLLQHLGDRYDEILHTHYRLLRDVWKTHDGYEVSTEGDAFFVAFESASNAVQAAVDAQLTLRAQEWPPDAAVRVRIGIHTGAARLYEGDYVGLAVHQAARVQSSAHGDQIVVSETTRVMCASDGIGFVDLGPHRLKDLAQPMRLFQVVHPELPHDFPPVRTLTVMPNNFPLQVTTFVGREDDIDRVKRTVADARIVTLTGAGGVGKTRLALQVGAELIDDFADGAWLVDLAPLADPTRVAAQLADTLGVRDQPGRAITATLSDHLLSKRLLIVLDNCEHVIDASAGVVHELVSMCPEVKILATSREALNVAGEVSYPLRSLAVPEDDAAVPSIAQAEAVRLFAQRARDVRPDFELTAENADAIAQICRRLDGLPLAIELAAARTKAMSAHEIAAKLDDRFRLLTGGARVAMPRQRTLEATVSWSYELLSETEQAVFDQLSVFAGGCTIDGAEHVCAGDGVGTGVVLDVLTRLVDRSLVVAEESPGGRTRYRMLETLRQFGRDRLLARGAASSVRDRHLAWMVDLAKKLPPQTGADPPPELTAESDNVRAAIEWAIESEDFASAIRIMSDVWYYNAHFDERERWFQRVLPHVDRSPADVAARLLAAAGGVAFMMGEWELAAGRNNAAAAVARRAGDDHILALSLLYEGASVWGMRDDEGAFELVEEGLEVAQRAGDDEMIRRGLIFAAWAKVDSEPDEAFTVASEVDRLSQTDGTPFDRAHAREVLGFVHAVRGEMHAAAEALAQAVPFFEAALASCSAHLLETSAAWMAMCGRFETGAELWGAADRLRAETNDRPRPWERTVHGVWLPQIRDELDHDAFETARTRGWRMGRLEALSFAERVLRSR